MSYLDHSWKRRTSLSGHYELSVAVWTGSDEDVRFQKASDLAKLALARLP